MRWSRNVLRIMELKNSLSCSENSPILVRSMRDTNGYRPSRSRDPSLKSQFNLCIFIYYVCIYLGVDIITCMCDYRRGLDWLLYLLTTYSS
jgi:hypothetical protein